MKKIIMLLLAISLLLMGSCSKNYGEDKTISVAVQYGLAYSPLHIMKEKGFLEELRPDVEVKWLKLGNTASIREAMLSGDLDAGFMGIPPFLIGRDKGMEWKIATGLSSSPLGLVIPVGSYSSLSDFDKNSKIALPQPGSIQHILLSMAAEKQLGNATILDNNLIALKHPDGLNALLSGSVNAHFTSPPYLFKEADNKDFEILITGDDAMGEPFTFIVGVVTEKFKKDNPGLYKDYLKALDKSMDFISNNQKESVEILAEAFSMEPDLLKEYLYRPGMLFNNSVKGLDRFISFMTTEGYLKNELTSESISF
ncbi:MAG: ABC transporter substrate-binding protein [Spirochaetaceae bacterium]